MFCAGHTVLSGLRAADPRPGERVAVLGIGGLGHLALQIAKALGAVVTGVCSAGNVDLVRSLGADHVLDYSKVDFTGGDARYDLVFDLVGNRPLAEIRRVLTPTGRMIACAGGAENEWVGPMPQVLAGLLSNLFSKQPFVSLMAKPNTDDLATVAGMVAAGTVRPVIDRRCDLSGVPDAMRHLGEGHSRGRTVVTL